MSDTAVWVRDNDPLAVEHVADHVLVLVGDPPASLRLFWTPAKAAELAQQILALLADHPDTTRRTT